MSKLYVIKYYYIMLFNDIPPCIPILVMRQLVLPRYIQSFCWSSRYMQPLPL